MKICIIGASGRFGLFMGDALINDSLVHEAPAIVSCRSESALTHAVRA